MAGEVNPKANYRKKTKTHNYIMSTSGVDYDLSQSPRKNIFQISEETEQSNPEQTVLTIVTKTGES